jgi:hypothetical protein
MNGRSAGFMVAAGTLLLAAMTPPAWAEELSPGMQAVQAMGRLNGLALACGQPALSVRAGDAVVTSAPKERLTGSVFEEATNSAYLGQGRSGARPCPDGKGLADQIAVAEQELKRQFPAPK